MLKKLQAITGLIFATFVAVHLLNTWLAGLGPAAYDGVQVALRQVYQFIFVEVLILSALLVHVVAGVMRIVKEPKRTLTIRARVHRYAGFFLMLVILGHILAVRGSSMFFDVYPGFAGLAFSIEFLPGFFYPYYLLLGVAGFYHALNGSGIALQRLSGRLGGLGWRFVLPQRRLALASSVAALVMVVSLLGFGGVWFDVGDVASSDFARLAKELLGVETTP
ncbi:MAG: hypothetical protein E2O59_00190 [Gammaproteobacteria bacterium]|nr:MAG: hypothetical protein E2O59_00190 [Gammaproteobacteria bacterium]